MSVGCTNSKEVLLDHALWFGNDAGAARRRDQAHRSRRHWYRPHHHSVWSYQRSGCKYNLQYVLLSMQKQFQSSEYHIMDACLLPPLMVQLEAIIIAILRLAKLSDRVARFITSMYVSTCNENVHSRRIFVFLHYSLPSLRSSRLTLRLRWTSVTSRTLLWILRCLPRCRRRGR